ncbi:alternate-type signal peptide domain-containing protein [Rhodococcus sp. ARC_M5]|uniref:alternate-type signal peptide domain-containing protein n=1 Tax=Rhodococcus sp. ARC_M5 TaxID=2928851 RepID=UPI001FB1D0FE|nr:alternate-type signal peptide domain-containing protein [Rhodococcus sp. ARC_M5]MCJ0891378.1 alternate-type signal peptide domain-containing protein [Rhodococcus sp. ARC_M5]
MNKATKGAVAAGAAAVLLLGGLGSYALWQDTETVTGGTIDSGELNFDPVAGTANWTETSVTPNADLGTDPSTFLIVPGDVLEYTTDYVVNWAGDNLRATITADFTDVAGDTDLAAALDTEVSVNGGTSLPNGSAVDLPLTTSPQTITVAVTITFDQATADLIAQNESVDLNAFTLTLDQVRPLP